MDRSNKKGKWTIMKYVNDFDLIIEYADTIRDLKAKVDEAEALNEAIYSTETFNAVKEKLNTAKTLLDRSDSSGSPAPPCPPCSRKAYRGSPRSLRRFLLYLPSNL